jgi:hypothetical protein
MGLYNEVWKTCPYCGSKGYTQVSTFSENVMKHFDVDSPESLAEELTIDELHLLYDMLKDDRFVCGGSPWSANNKDCCGRTFPLNLEDDEKMKQERIEVAKKLFGKESD